jgi:hypothetical protein
MTAIASVYTPEGFVVGADGRECLPNGDKLSDNKCKLFPAKADGTNAVYGFAGCVKVGSFDILLESHKIEYELRDKRFKSLADYALKLSEILYYRLSGHTAGVDFSSSG